MNLKMNEYVQVNETGETKVFGYKILSYYTFLKHYKLSITTVSKTLSATVFFHINLLNRFPQICSFSARSLAAGIHILLPTEKIGLANNRSHTLFFFLC